MFNNFRTESHVNIEINETACSLKHAADTLTWAITWHAFTNK